MQRAEMRTILVKRIRSILRGDVLPRRLRPRIEKAKKMEAAKIAPLAVYLASEAAASVSGQIFGIRANEIYLNLES